MNNDENEYKGFKEWYDDLPDAMQFIVFSLAIIIIPSIFYLLMFCVGADRNNYIMKFLGFMIYIKLHQYFFKS